MPTTATTLANTVLADVGSDFTLPAVNLSGAQFQLPSAVGNPLYDAIVGTSINDLTSGTPDGAGMFDKIMASIQKHLKEEYDNGRISGDQYAKSYVDLTNTSMSAALQMLLQSETAKWQAYQAQMSARAAEVQAVEAAVKLETAKAELAAQTRNANLINVQYANGMMDLAIKDAEQRVAEKKVAGETFNVTYIQPQELANLQVQEDVLTAQKYNTEADTNVKIETVTQMQYRTLNVLPEEVRAADLENQIRDYKVDFIMPAQRKLVEEQAETARAQTMDTRSNGVTPIFGVAGKQKDLYSQQIDSYKKDAAYKVGKLFSDAYMTQATLEIADSVPNNFTGTEINEVLANLRAGVSLGS